MKRLFTLLMALLLVAGTATTALAQDKKQKKNANIQEVTFVTTIDCKNCVKKVEANLPYEKGIKDMKVNLDDRTVWIKYDAAKTDKTLILLPRRHSEHSHIVVASHFRPFSPQTRPRRHCEPPHSVVASKLAQLKKGSRIVALWRE